MAIIFSMVIGLILLLAFALLLVGFTMKVKALKVVALVTLGALVALTLLLGQAIGRM